MMSSGFFMLLFGGLLMHPTEETLCELQWNSDSRRIEISLRLSLADEERLLNDASKSQASVKGKPGVASLKPQQIVLGRHLTFGDDEACLPADPLANASRYQWVGRREEGIHVWWFTEYSVDAPETESTNGPPSHVRCVIFADVSRRTVHPNGHGPHDAFQNTFVVLGHPVPVSAVVTPRDPVAALQWPDAE